MNEVITPKHLGRIADIMCEWEGRIADELELSEADVSAIIAKHPRELKLQMYVRKLYYVSITLLLNYNIIRREALGTWRRQQGNTATYNNLISVFECAGYQAVADYINKLEPEVRREFKIEKTCSKTSVLRPVYPDVATTTISALQIRKGSLKLVLIVYAYTVMYIGAALCMSFNSQNLMSI